MTHLFINKIKEFEGFSSRAYLCPAGYWTIGYGHLTDDKEATISEADATTRLIRDLEEARGEAIELMPAMALCLNQQEAMASWVMNLGASALSTSTLRKKYNNGDVQGAANEITRWIHCHINGKKTPLKGLIRRREWEKRLFLYGLYS